MAVKSEVEMKADEVKAQKKQLKEEQKKMKKEQKAQKREVKKRAKEIERQEAELDVEEGAGLSVTLVTLLIVAIWVAIICLLIKLDVGGFGSGILYPVLKDVPVVNKILPAPQEDYYEEDEEEEDESQGYDGYANIREAVAYIKELELQLEQAQSDNIADRQRLEELQEEIKRLRTFEDSQVEFERIKDEFYSEVVYAEKGPGADEYRKYYESINPEMAEELYKQVVRQAQVDARMEDYVNAYSTMKPKEAAKVFEAMTDDLVLASQILGGMDAESRGKILGAMDPEIAARLTKLMEP